MHEVMDKIAAWLSDNGFAVEDEGQHPSNRDGLPAPRVKLKLPDTPEGHVAGSCTRVYVTPRAVGVWQIRQPYNHYTWQCLRSRPYESEEELREALAQEANTSAGMWKEPVEA